MQQKWIDEGGMYFPINGEFILHATPGPGIFRVAQSPKPMDPRLGLVPVSEKFEFDYKIYPLGQEHICERIKALWFNKEYIGSGKNLGVIFNGTKGTGKTVAAKLLCNELGLPVIIVTDTFKGAILPFIQSLNFECVVLLDEAEKTFSKDENDDKILLSLIDGVYNNSRKLYILTTNRLTVNENLLGRPGRIRYIQEFRNLPIQAINEYCEDNLKDKSKLERVLAEVDLLEISTIDILKAIVEEINIFGDLTDSVQLNIPKAKYVFNVAKFAGCTKEDIESIEKIITALNPHHKPLDDWFNSMIPLSSFPEELLASCMKSDRFVDHIFDLNEGKRGRIAEVDYMPKKVVVGVGGTVSSFDDKDEEKEIGLESLQAVYAQEVFPALIENCQWTDTRKLTCNYGDLWKNEETSLGTVIESPNNHGIFIIQDYYDKVDEVYLLLKKKNNPSLYRGGLGLLI